jgi:predicted DNA binding protein
MTVALQASAGSGRGYLDRTPVELDGNDEPTARAVIDRETTIIDNVAAGLDDETWRLALLERGFRSIAAIPLLHDGMRHGVVTVHADHPNAFDELRAVMDDIGRIISHASTAIQCQNALLSHASMELEVEINAPACFFVRFVEETETSVSFGSISSTDDGWSLVFLTAEEPELLLERAERAVSVRSAQLLEDDADGLIEVQFDDSFIGSFLSRHGISIQRASATPEEVQITVSIPPSMSPRQALGAIQAKYPESRLLAKRDQRHAGVSSATSSDSIFDRLTDRQREAIERAYADGYFEVPKQVTGEEIAESMDISTSTFHNHLRAAEAELFAWLFDTRQE